MGFFSDAADKIRTYFRADKEKAALQLSPMGLSAATGYNLLQTYGYNELADHLRVETDLISRYIDYEEMEENAYVSAAMDVYADDATQTSVVSGRAIWVESKDKGTERLLNDLLHRTLRIDEELWEIARTLVKYGNDMEELLVTNEGVKGLVFLPPPTVRRVEGPKGVLYGFVQDTRGKFQYTAQEFQQELARRIQSSPSQSTLGSPYAVPFEDWEVAHFRLKGKSRRSLYGFGVGEAARFAWKRLTLLEDSALIFRLQRAPEKLAYYVDVGDLPPAEALAYVNRVRQQHRKTKFFNPLTGKIDLKFHASPQDEDIYIPVRKGVESTRVEVVGSPSWQCLTGDTRVSLLDDTTKTIREMAEEGGAYPVYSCNKEGQVVAGVARSARMSHPSADIWHVGLSDGSVVRCTDNHPFLLSTGQWILAKDLAPRIQLKARTTASCVVESVRKTDVREPVYDLTVDDYHCFAIGQTGVFVHNSMDDIDYFRSAVFAAMKVPKAYLAQDDNTARAILSSEDVRFAKSVMRVQGELRNGFSKICRVHLAALNINPAALDYELKMTVPSAIFELAQMEVRNARADLAGRMKEMVSLHWVLEKVFGLGEEEIQKVISEREEDVIRDSIAQAKGQAEAQKLMGPPPGMEGGEGGGPPPEAPAPEGFPPEAPMESRKFKPRRSISEQELFRGGSREGEKRASAKLDRLLRNDVHLAHRLEALGNILRDVARSR